MFRKHREGGGGVEMVYDDHKSRRPRRFYGLHYTHTHMGLKGSGLVGGLYVVVFSVF